eukprot:UN03381
MDKLPNLGHLKYANTSRFSSKRLPNSFMIQQIVLAISKRSGTKLSTSEICFQFWETLAKLDELWTDPTHSLNITANAHELDVEPFKSMRYNLRIT